MSSKEFECKFTLPFTADSPYFPFNARPGSQLSPAKAKIIPAGLRPAKDELTGTATALDSQWGVYGLWCMGVWCMDSGYYLGVEGVPNSVGAAGAGEWPSSYPASYQTYEEYSFIPETEPSQGLPPMSSLTPNGTPSATTMAGPNAATSFGPANHTDGAGVVVNKALGGIYPAAEVYTLAGERVQLQFSTVDPRRFTTPMALSAWLTNHSTSHSPTDTQAVTVNNTIAPQRLHMPPATETQRLTC